MIAKALTNWFFYALLGLFIIFLYGPMFGIILLSFQGPDGGLTFPMNGMSLHWIGDLFKAQRVGDFQGSFLRSLSLGLLVSVLTTVFSYAAGLAFRRGFPGATFLFYLTVTSLIVPSILVSLGIGLTFSRLGLETHWMTSALGAHLTWTLPFGLLIMFAIFNRFDPSYEEAARDLGASFFQVQRMVVVPMIAPSLIGIALFGFTLSFDEFARTLLSGGVKNTLPLEIFGMTTTVTTPTLYALGTVTTVVSFTVILVGLAVIAVLNRRATASKSAASEAVA